MLALMRTLAILVLLCACGESPAHGLPPPRAEHRSIPNALRVDPLEPRAIRVALDELPPPYANESVRRPPRLVEPPSDATLRVPRGFAVQLFAEGIASARWLALTPDGRVLVAQSRENRIAILDDADHDGVAERIGVFADEANGLDIPFGMAFVGRRFYLGNQNAVLRFAWRDGRRRLEGRGERIAQLPGGGYRQHWTRNVVAAPDGEHLFVSVGSRSNADPEREPRATIQRMRLDGSDMHTFASGLRNAVGLAIHPRTGALFATVNERDHLGDDLVPDFLARIEEGAFYGWPYAYLSPSLLDPRLTRGGRSVQADLAARTRTPEVLFAAHSVALGIAFYEGTSFPERYRNGAFVAMRGSWNRSAGTGYKIVFVPFDDEGQPRGDYEDFLTGFLIDPSGPTTWGRPVAVLALPDGSLLFTDEPGGRVYRVSYPRSRR
jgi:glucose/arabinose dehydrogenase